METTKTKIVIWIVLPILVIVTSLVVMIKYPSTPSKTDFSKDKQSKVVSNTDSDKNHFNESNLDPESIPSDKYVKELASELVNLNNDNEVETFKGNYKVSERAGFQLPEQNSKLDTVVKFKTDYPSDMGTPSLHIDLSTLRGTHVEYLVTYHTNPQELNYKLVFDDKILSNITNLS